MVLWSYGTFLYRAKQSKIEMGHGSPHVLSRECMTPRLGEHLKATLSAPAQPRIVCSCEKSCFLMETLDSREINGMITLWPYLARVAEKVAKKVPFFETPTGTIWTMKTSPKCTLRYVIINHRQCQTFMLLPEIFAFYRSQFIHLSHSIHCWLGNINFEANLYSSSEVYFSSTHVPFSPC